MDSITFRVSFVALLMGRSPDQLGPMSKSTSGIVEPSTKNSGMRNLSEYVHKEMGAELTRSARIGECDVLHASTAIAWSC